MLNDSSTASLDAESEISAQITPSLENIDQQFEEKGEKRGRGRPRKHPVAVENTVKRSRGRPRKYDIVEKERLSNGEYKSVIKKVDSGHLLKQMYNYFTKLLIIHNELSKDNPKYEALFVRLKHLDFQMAEVCKTVLAREYIGSSIEENEVA